MLLPRLSALLATLLLTLCATAAAKDAKTIDLAIIPWPGWVPALADHAGKFWEAEGLTVNVIVYDNDALILEDLVSGKIDASLAMLGNYVGANLDGSDIVILGETNWSHGGDKVLMQKNKNPADYIGQPVGMYLTQPSVRFFFHQTMQPLGLDSRTFPAIEITDPKALADKFIAKELPFIVIYDPEALRAMRQGDGRVLASSATIPGVIPEGFGMHRKRRAELSHDTLVAFFRGWFRCVNWTRDYNNWPEYQTLLREKAFGIRTSEADLLAMQAAVKVHTAGEAARRNAENGGTENYLDDLTHFLKNGNELPENWTYETMLDNAAFREAAQQIANE